MSHDLFSYATLKPRDYHQNLWWGCINQQICLNGPVTVFFTLYSFRGPCLSRCLLTSSDAQNIFWHIFYLFFYQYLESLSLFVFFFLFLISKYLTVTFLLFNCYYCKNYWFFILNESTSKEIQGIKCVW